MPNLILITLLAAFPALSTDMYLPAIPTLQKIWNISLPEANLSLVIYFATFSLLLLVHGPLSDRFGRKPVLGWGILLFIAGCLLCASADSITGLVLARMVQATGAAAASALSLALARDMYEGKERQKVLAYIGVILPLCPMVAPMIGGLLLEYLSWRWIFVLQGLLALVSLYGSMRLKEPLFERTRGGVVSVARRYKVLLGNKDYVSYTLAFCIMPASFFSFIAASSNIYIVGFGLSEQAYGLFFGFNALCMMAGSLLCSRLCVGYSTFSILVVALAGMLAAGVAMVYTTGDALLEFVIPMGAISFFVGLSRPLSISMVIEQVETDVGAASALLSFTFFIFGAIAMELVSFDWWPTKAVFIGGVAVLGSLLPLAAVISMHTRHKRAAAG